MGHMGINWPGYMLGGCVRTARGSLVQLHLLPLTLVKCPLLHAWPQCRLVPCIRASLHACNPMFHTRPICSPCAHPLQLQDNADPGRQGHPPDQLARCGWAHTLPTSRIACLRQPFCAACHRVAWSTVAWSAVHAHIFDCALPSPHAVLRCACCAGFVVEISGAVVVMLCSRYGLPISTTHCLVGAVVGIGEPGQQST